MTMSFHDGLPLSRKTGRAGLATGCWKATLQNAT